MPEDLSLALPHVRRMIEAFNIPVITCDGLRRTTSLGRWFAARKRRVRVLHGDAGQGFWAVGLAPDVSPTTVAHGDGIEVLGAPEILLKWGIERVEQVIDVLALWGDVSDNIPGVPASAKKTAGKLISQYGSVEICWRARRTQRQAEGEP